jgi:16S rRNA processing protein RimM
VVPAGWVALGTVISTRGNKGEVVVELLTSGVERFLEVKRLHWFAEGKPERELEAAHAWMHQGKTVLQFAGVASINDAEALRGGDLCIPLADRRILAPGEIFVSDWIGMDLVDEAGSSLGRVSNWFEEGELAWLELQPGGQLVPYVREFFLSVDAKAKRITARLPEGLLETAGQ